MHQGPNYPSLGPANERGFFQQDGQGQQKRNEFFQGLGWAAKIELCFPMGQTEKKKGFQTGGRRITMYWT